MQHRDLKLENILYEHKGPDAGIKVRTAIRIIIIILNSVMNNEL
jgi:hypothetical protein